MIVFITLFDHRNPRAPAKRAAAQQPGRKQELLAGGGGDRGMVFEGSPDANVADGADRLCLG